MITIPFEALDAFSEDIDIDNITYRFSFIYNNRGDYWSMTISDLTDNIIISGIKLILGYDLLEPYHYLAIPIGKLFIVDETMSFDRISKDDFVNDRNLQMIYATEDELATI